MHSQDQANVQHKGVDESGKVPNKTKGTLQLPSTTSSATGFDPGAPQQELKKRSGRDKTLQNAVPNNGGKATNINPPVQSHLPSTYITIFKSLSSIII